MQVSIQIGVSLRKCLQHHSHNRNRYSLHNATALFDTLELCSLSTMRCDEAKGMNRG